MVIFIVGNDLSQALAADRSHRLSRPAPRPGRKEVAAWVARYADGRACRADVVFEHGPGDGVLPPIEHFGLVRTVNLPEGKRALHEIAGPANRAAESDRVIVVTDDTKLTEAVRRGKARALGASEFIARVRSALGGGENAARGEPDEKYSGLSDEDVGYWLRVFQEDGQ